MSPGHTRSARHTVPARVERTATAELARAALLRFSALLFHPPDRAARRALGELCESLPEAFRKDAAALAARLGTEDAETEYHRLLGGSGAVPDCESDYAVAGLGGKGPLVADVAGFYAAFGYPGPASVPLQPDHVSAELDFLAFLGLKTSYARNAGMTRERATCERAAGAFLEDHLGPFLEAFLARLAAAGEDGVFADAARFCAEALQAIT
jgi:TorA maturation chaperone TorD